MQPITDEIVQNLIKSFWKLNAGRVPLSDFLPIVDHEGFFMELAGTDIRFSGIAGLGDHQIGKLIYSDKEFILLDFQIDVDGDTALARTRAQGNASTWTLSCSGPGRANRMEGIGVEIRKIYSNGKRA